MGVRLIFRAANVRFYYFGAVCVMISTLLRFDVICSIFITIVRYHSIALKKARTHDTNVAI